MVAEDARGGGDSAISPDGRKFLTSLRRSGNWDIWMFDIAAGSWSQITRDNADEFEARWSPDAKSIVYTSTKNGNKDIFTQVLASGATRQLTDDPEDDEYPVYAPDGKAVSFTGGRWKDGRQFFTVGLDGTGRRAISGAPSKAGACSFHPSGESLACHTYDTGTGNVYLYPRYGNGARVQLTNGSFWDYKPTIAPGGEWMAFSRSEEGPSAIWLARFPVGEAFPLTTSDSDDRWPTWSDSGHELFFHRLVDRGKAVILFDPATGSRTEVVGPEDAPGAATMSPAGDRVAYGTRVTGKERLRVRDLSSGRVQELKLDLPEDAEASFPRWSPTGGQIAFAVKTGMRWDVAVTSAVGGPVRVLTSSIANARGIRGPIDWSPDGKRLVFHVSTRPFEANLYLADVASGALQNLTNDNWFSEAPSFTADGKAITFMSTRAGNWTWGFFEMELATGKVKLLLGPDYVEKNYPRSNGGGALLWSEFEPGGHEVLALRNRAGVIAKFASPTGWARWPAFAPDGKRVLYTAIDHRVEYWLAENLHSPDSPIVAARNRNPEISETEPKGSGPNRSAKRASPVQMHHR